MKKIVSLFAVLALAIAAPARGASVSLNFDSLPSQQGWQWWISTLYWNGPEQQFFSVGNGVLHQDTMSQGQPDGEGPACAYDYSGPEVTNDFFDIQFRARVTDYKQFTGYPQGWYNGTGFGVVIGGAGGGAFLGINTSTVGHVNANGGEDIVVFVGDNTAYHDYRMQGSLGANGLYNMYRDGVLLAGNIPLRLENSSTQPYIAFGDLTNGAQAIADISAFTYSNVPEPATLLLLTLGGLALRRRK